MNGLEFKDLEEGKLYKHIGYENYYSKKNGLLFRVDYNEYADFSNPWFILGMRFVEMVEKEKGCVKWILKKTHYCQRLSQCEKIMNMR